MRISHVGHASYLFQTTDVRIAMDPVFFDPFEAGANSSYPQRTVDVDMLPHIDVILISHRHFDHFDLRTLSLFNRDIPCVFPQGDNAIMQGLLQLGFRNVRGVPAGVKLKFGQTSVITTPSLVEFPEIGVIFCDPTATVWNCVDSVIDRQVINDFRKTVGSIDCVLATYNPLIQMELRHQAQSIFPFERYKQLLQNVAAIMPRVVVPSACGLQYSVGSWQNNLGFPLTPHRFLEDLAAIDPSAQGLRMLPGDELLLTSDLVDHTTSSSEFVACTGCQETDCILWKPNPGLGVPRFRDLNPLGNDPFKVATRAIDYLKTQFLVDLEKPECADLLEMLREWKVQWQVDIYAPIQPNRHNPELLHGPLGAYSPIRTFTMKFSDDALQWSDGALEFVTMHTAMSASGMVDAIDGRITNYSFHFTDRYRYSQRIYRADACDITSPPALIEEPIAGVLARLHEVDEKYVTSQAEYWLTHDPTSGREGARRI